MLQAVDDFSRLVDAYFARISAQPDQARCGASAAVWGGSQCIRRAGHSGAHCDEGHGWWTDDRAAEAVEKMAGAIHDC